MDRVELIAVRPCRLKPIPLHDSGLEESGRRVGIVFEQLRRTLATIGEVKSAVEILFTRMPAGRYSFPGDTRDAQSLQGLLAGLNHMIHQGERHLLQIARRRLNLVDRRRGEAIAHRLVPIARAFDGVEGKAQITLDMSAPVGAGRHRNALHGVQPPEVLR
jgi:hypothetical protein